MLRAFFPWGKMGRAFYHGSSCIVARILAYFLSHFRVYCDKSYRLMFDLTENICWLLIIHIGSHAHQSGQGLVHLYPPGNGQIVHRRKYKRKKVWFFVICLHDKGHRDQVVADE